MSKIYLLTQNQNTGYDTYDGVVVVADSEEEAKKIHPSEYYIFQDDGWYFKYSDGKINDTREYTAGGWAEVEDITATIIGESDGTFGAGTVVCASFNAG